MSVPDGMEPELPDQPGYGSGSRPFVLRQRQIPPATVVVTWSLPGLQRAEVRVPESAWLTGDHLAVGQMITDLLAAIDPTPRTADVEAPADDLDD